MRIHTILPAIVLAFISSSASAALVSLVHALPALPESIPANNPVDIAINGRCQYVAKPYGSKIGPKQVDAGEFVILFYETKESKSCGGTLLGEIILDVEADDEVDIVLGLDRNDLVSVSVWNNIYSLDAVEEGAPTAVEVRHVGASPKVSVELRTAGEEVQSVEVLPGQQGLMTSEAGKTSMRVVRGRETLDKSSGRLKSGYVYWTYVAGSGFKQTLELLTLRSVPKQRPIPDENTPPPTVKPQYVSCCLFNVCAQLSQANCATSSGVYIGNVPCTPDPC